MKVHVVGGLGRADQVLTRLARYLTGGLDWGHGQAPDPGAHVNVYMPYLELTPKTAAPGPSVAWFTHLEPQRVAKVRAWQVAAQLATLRTCQTPLYRDRLREHGPTQWLPAPVELDRFTLRGRVPKERIVGVAGQVYPGGRKGEDKVRWLVANGIPARHSFTLTASGKDWPVPCKHRPWSAMPGFYAGLSAYACTALDEGGPLGVLEALATGVPVVIPEHVGMLDELPDMPGIVRYDGSPHGLAEGIVLALEGRYVLEHLRQAVEGYSVTRWLQEWHLAVEVAMDFYQEAPAAKAPAPKPAEPDLPQRGAFVVAYGKPSRECALRLIESWKLHMPDVPIALASTEPLGPEDVFVETPDLDIGGRSVKTQMYDYAPANWGRILYLDADTQIVAPVHYLFQLLDDGWELAICINPDKYASATMMTRPDNKDEIAATQAEVGTLELVQLQGGVMAFRRCAATRELFARWHKEWQRWGKRDQAALLRASMACPVRTYLLGVEWNTSDRYPAPNGSAGIWHRQTTARRWEGIVEGRLDSDEAWKAVRE